MEVGTSAWGGRAGGGGGGGEVWVDGTAEWEDISQ